MKNIRVLAKPAFSNKLLNPYNWLLYTNLEKQGVRVAEYCKVHLAREKWDIIHVHWPNNVMSYGNWWWAFYKTVYLLLSLTFAKLRGSKVRGE